MNSTTISTREVLCLQALSRLRWQLLLDVPSLAATVEQTLRPLAERNPSLKRELILWLRSSLHPFPLDEYGRRTRQLANAVRRADPLGSQAMVLLARSRQQLLDDDVLATRLHAEALVLATERYVNTRNSLALRGSGLIQSVVERTQIPDDDRADAFQEGVLGLLEAFELFTPSDHVSFNGVARQYVSRRLLALPTRLEHSTLPGRWSDAA